LIKVVRVFGLKGEVVSYHKSILNDSIKGLMFV